MRLNTISRRTVPFNIAHRTTRQFTHHQPPSPSPTIAPPPKQQHQPHKSTQRNPKPSVSRRRVPRMNVLRLELQALLDGPHIRLRQHVGNAVLVDVVASDALPNLAWESFEYF